MLTILDPKGNKYKKGIKSFSFVFLFTWWWNWHKDSEKLFNKSWEEIPLFFCPGEDTIKENQEELRKSKIIIS